MNDREALCDLFDHTKGKYWKTKWNWTIEERCSKWHGVKVQNGRVVCLMLNDNCLRGNLIEWKSMKLLTHISIFSMYSNLLEGPIPSVIGCWQNLTELNLSWNNLTG